MCAHVSEFPVGTYKKAHYHGPGAHVIILSGRSYSLIWPKWEPIQRFDWGPESMIVPPANWFHQHFNMGAEPARYLAFRWGSKKFFSIMNEGTGGSDKDIKLGGKQIECRDEDPKIYEMFEASLAENGARCRMGSKVPHCPNKEVAPTT